MLAELKFCMTTWFFYVPPSPTCGQMWFFDQPPLPSRSSTWFKDGPFAQISALFQNPLYSKTLRHHSFLLLGPCFALGIMNGELYQIITFLK